MKPRIRPHPRYRGMWQCGGLRFLDWCEGWSPREAYYLWALSVGRSARWVNGRYVG